MEKHRARILLGNETFAEDIDVEVNTIKDPLGADQGWTVSTPPDFPHVPQSKPQTFRIELDDGRKGDMMVDDAIFKEGDSAGYFFRGVGPLV